MKGRTCIAYGEDFDFAAARTGSRGPAGIRIRGNFESIFDLAHPGSFQFKRCVAIIAHVVEATLRLAGIDDFAGAAVWAKD